MLYPLSYRRLKAVDLTFIRARSRNAKLYALHPTPNADLPGCLRGDAVGMRPTQVPDSRPSSTSPMNPTTAKSAKFLESRGKVS